MARDPRQSGSAFTGFVGMAVIVGAVVFASVWSVSWIKERSRLSTAREFSSRVDRALGDLVAGKWLFDECQGLRAADEIGIGGEAELIGGVTWSKDTPFASGCSLLLDGRNDYVKTDLALSANPSNPVTISAWAKTGTKAGMQALVGHGEEGRIDMWRDGERLRCRGQDLVSVSAYGPTPIADDKWHHLLCVFDGSGVTAFVDGKPGEKATGVTSARTGLVYLGKTGSLEPNRSWSGLIDSVAVFTRAFQP